MRDRLGVVAELSLLALGTFLRASLLALLVAYWAMVLSHLLIGSMPHAGPDQVPSADLPADQAYERGLREGNIAAGR
jgi:hypothetical protein